MTKQGKENIKNNKDREGEENKGEGKEEWLTCKPSMPAYNMMSVDAIIFDVANGDRPKRAHVPSTVATLEA